ncbi:MAG: D-aminoacyl-tRNA deacylase [Erysipelotrichaceae bacterium]|nr:D-aminoacyl-tRNA deacylase [Erysipelotrichaceae bacterium]
MKIVVQRVKKASCIVDDQLISEIAKGYMILVGIEQNDDEQTLMKLASKLSKLRIFDDEKGKMNLNIFDAGGEILSISQFTLAANIKKGNRPSFDTARKPDEAKLLYHRFNEILKTLGIVVKEGIFASEMLITLENDGPITFVLDSEEL